MNSYIPFENIELESPFDLAKNSSIGCGGTAKTAYFPRSVAEMTSLVQALERANVPYYAVGNMTNVLPPDGESERVFVVTKRMKSIAAENGFFAEAGVTGGAILRECKRRRLSGAEFLEGIPCTLGGALYMNAGVGGAYIGDIVESVTVLRSGQILTLPKAECGYAYKKSVFMQNDDLIVGATLRLTEASETEIEERTAYYAAKRAHLPKGKSMGCVFKNPEGLVAGKLVEGAGLKGFRVGGARVSEKHANFILNDKNATSAQIRSLIGIVKNAVFAQYKIRLEEEIRYLE